MADEGVTKTGSSGSGRKITANRNLPAVKNTISAPKMKPPKSSGDSGSGGSGGSGSSGANSGNSSGASGGKE